MSLITEKPDDLKPQNDLDDIEDPDLNEYGLSIDRYLAFGTTPKAIPNPPKDGEVVTFQVKVECVGQAHRRRADGEVRYRSELTILSVARAGEELPPDYETEAQAKARAKAEEEAKVAEAAENQPPLYDDAGEPVDGTDWGSTEPDDDPDTDPEDDDNVIRPPFSDGPR